jgi:hypothetical protein
VWIDGLVMGLSLQRSCPDGDDEVRGGFEEELMRLVYFGLALSLAPCHFDFEAFLNIFDHEQQKLLHQQPNLILNSNRASQRKEPCRLHCELFDTLILPKVCCAPIQATHLKLDFAY